MTSIRNNPEFRDTPRQITEAVEFTAQRTRALVEMAAFRYGWPSELARLADQERLMQLGVRIAHRRREMGDACMAALDVEESLRDWIAGGQFTFSATAAPTVEGIDYTVGMASLAAWYHYRHECARLEQDTWEFSDAFADAHRQRLAEIEGAA
jgi:hypothetical protein